MRWVSCLRCLGNRRWGSRAWPHQAAHRTKERGTDQENLRQKEGDPCNRLALAFSFVASLNEDEFGIGGEKLWRGRQIEQMLEPARSYLPPLLTRSPTVVRVAATWRAGRGCWVANYSSLMTLALISRCVSGCLGSLQMMVTCLVCGPERMPLLKVTAMSVCSPD